MNELPRFFEGRNVSCDGNELNMEDKKLQKDFDSEENQETSSSTPSTETDTPDLSSETVLSENESSDEDPQHPEEDSIVVSDASQEEESESDENSDESVSEELETVETIEQTESEEIVDDKSLSSFEAIVQRAEYIAQSKEWGRGQSRFDTLKEVWDSLPTEEIEESERTSLHIQFQKAEQTFQERKAEHYKIQDERRLANLEKKRSVLAQLEDIVQKGNWHANRDFRHLSRKFEDIKFIPRESAHELDETFNKLQETFEANRVDYLVEQKKKEDENLEGKRLLLDKIKAFIDGITDENADWEALESEYESLLKHWKKIGRVPKENTHELVDKFNGLKNAFYDKKYELNSAHRKELDSNEKKQRKLIERTKALKEYEDLAEAARVINQLHNNWKNVGPVYYKVSETLWNEFKAASDDFNAFKNEHIEVIKEQEQINYEAKERVCEEAEKLAESTQWKETSNKFQELLKEWKQTGPAPRRKADKLWKRFKAAMDTFYNNKREFTKEIRDREKENYRKKREIVDQVVALHEAEDPQDAIAKVRELQQQFKNIGFVPIKQKDKIYRLFKEACDVVYDRARSENKQDGGSRGDFSSNVGSKAQKEIQGKYNQINKLRKQADELTDNILNYKDTKTFIKPNAKGIALREEIDTKIDSLQDELDKVNAEIDALRNDVDSLQDDD